MDGRIDEEDARMKEDDLLPDPATFLESYPRCKRLLDAFRANPNTHNKTPLAVLHEYATRLSLEVTLFSAHSAFSSFPSQCSSRQLGALA